MAPLTICLTGGTGFIGRHFIRRLERENVTIRALTRASITSSNRIHSSNLAYVQGDLLDQKSLCEFVDKGAVVVNLAYLPAKSHEENLEAANNLASTCQEKGISRFVHVSTAIVAGDAASPVVTENTECKPATDYEVGKLKLEALVTRKLEKKCEVAVLRPTCVFGANGQNLVKLARELTSDSNLVKHLKRSLFDRRRLNLVSVENVVEALWFLSSSKNSLPGTETFIVSEDDVPENNYADVTNFLASQLLVEMPQWPQLPRASALLPTALRLVRQSRRNPYLVYSSEKLQQFGFQKAISFEAGLKLFADWYRSEFSKRCES